MQHLIRMLFREQSRATPIASSPHVEETEPKNANLTSVYYINKESRISIASVKSFGLDAGFGGATFCSGGREIGFVCVCVFVVLERLIRLFEAFCVLVFCVGCCVFVLVWKRGTN